MDSLGKLSRRIKEFNDARDWGQFHTPKNLAMGLCVEASELMEHFIWLTPEESLTLRDEKREDVRDEAADIFIYLLNLSEKLDFDLVEAAHDKLVKNELKYPVHKSRGSAKKYDEL